MAKSQTDGCSQCKEIKSEAEKAKAKLDEMKKQMEAFKTLANKKTTAAYNNMVELLVQNFEDILDDTNSDTAKSLDVNKEVQEKTTTTPTKNLKRKLPLAKTNKDGSTRSKVLKNQHNTPSSNNKKYLLKSSGGITTVKRPAAMVRVSGRARRTSYKDFIKTNGTAKKQKSNSNKKEFTSKKNKKNDPEVSEDEDEDEFTFENSQDESNLSRSRRVITPNKKYSSYWLNPSIKKQRHQNDSTVFEKSAKSSTKEENVKRGRGRPRKHSSDTKNPTTNKYIKQEPGLSDSERTIRIKSEPKSPVIGNSRSPKIPVSQSNEIKVIKLTNSSQELNKFDSDSPELVVFVRSKRVASSSPPSYKFL